MADRVEVFDVTVTAGTAQAAPAVTDVSFPPGEVVGVEVVIPDGAAGLAGWQLLQAHQAVLPRTAGKFITGNDEVVKWPLSGYTNSGSWQFAGYNTDVFDHTFGVRFLVDEIGHVTPGPSFDGPQAAGAIDTIPIGAGDQAPGGLDATGGDLPPLPADTTPPDTGVGDTGGDLPPEPPADDSGAPPDTGLPADDTLPPEADLPPAPDETPPDGATSPGGGSAKGGKGGKGGKKRPPAKGGRPHPAKRTAPARTIVTHRQLPAGGWLPAGARFDLRRVDQGQDFITDWHGPIVAPGPGRVVSIGHDGVFPSGFGPRYPVVEITAGRWAGRRLYIGHTTATVHAGQHFTAGEILALADQGHVEGGGWVEIGEASALGQGIHDQGARIAHLFGPLAVEVRHPAPSHLTARKGHAGGHVPAHPKRAPAAAPRAHHPGSRGAPAKRAPAALPSHPAGHGGGHATPARRAPAPSPHRPPAPAPRRAPAPPPPPAPRRAPAPTRRRGR